MTMRSALLTMFVSTSLDLALPGPVVGADLDASNVYQRIKDADANGFTVGRSSGNGEEPEADLVLDEQGEASGGRGSDAAPRPLFRRVAEAKLDTGTYPEFIALLDNHVVRAREAESDTPEERAEVDRFLDEAVATSPMRLAYTYITEVLGNDLTEAEFRERVEDIWFDVYTNHFGNRPTPHCSGFEHVFVGEGQFGDAGRGEVSGYHSWIKFLLDERAGLVDYLGHKYDLPASRRPGNPCVITLRMIWDHDEDGPGGGPPVELFKPKGGFFVGTSPECELAMGTVAFFEHVEGRLRDDRRRIVLDGDSYELVLYPSVNPNGQRGEHVRSFFPVLLAADGPAGGDTPVQPIVDDEGLVNSGPIVIARALPNPEGDDQIGEWVELSNTTDAAIALDGWELRDRMGRPRALEGVLAAGETGRFEVPRDRHEMQLGNNGGRALLFQGSQLVGGVAYDRVASGEILTFVP